MNKRFKYKAKIILVQYHAFSDIKTGESKMKNGIVVNDSLRNEHQCNSYIQEIYV